MLGGIFGSKDSSQGKSPAILGIVGDGDAVGFGVVADAVDARYFSFADRTYGQLIGCTFRRARDSPVGSLESSFYPFVLTVEILQNTSASVMAVPLGASILWMWCVSLIVTS